MKWKKVKLGEVCDITSSKRCHLSERTKNGIPFYCSKEIILKFRGEEVRNSDFISQELYDDIKDKYGVPKKGDLLITTRGSIGIPYLYKESDEFYFADGNLTWLKNFSDRLLPKYLYYWLLTEKGIYKINAIAKGTAQKALSIADLKLMEIVIPNVSIQYKIVAILSAYDDLIENNRRQIALLEEAASRLYKEWFVDFHFPGHEQVKIVDGVPEGWVEKYINEICDTIGGGTPSTKVKEYYDGGTVRWVTPTDITQNSSIILLDTAKKITEEGLQHSSAKLVPPYTILMTSRASVGYFALCRHEVCTNQGFISCVPKSENYRMYLLYNLMNRVDEIRNKAGGSTYLEIKKTTFRNMKILLPHMKLLKLFNEYIWNILKDLQKKEMQNHLLQEARDRLLPKLMSGEIEVRP